MSTRETLRQKQSRFVRDVALLILFAESLGYELTFGDAWRSPEERARRGFPDSLHGDRLAVDLNLFRDGHWLSSTKAHRPLGEFWESLGADHHWGGHFNDGNHYSIGHGGRK